MLQYLLYNITWIPRFMFIQTNMGGGGKFTFEQISPHGLLFPRPCGPKCKVGCSGNVFTI